MNDVSSFQCFDAVGSVTGGTTGLLKMFQFCQKLSFGELAHPDENCQ